MSSLYKRFVSPGAGQQISTTPGSIDKVIVNAHSSGTFKLWDTSADRGALETLSGTCIGGTYTPAAGSSSILIEASFSRGLYVDTAGTSSDLTILYNGSSVR